MSFNGHTYGIGASWECMPIPYRNINKMFADAAASMTPYVLGITVDAAFALSYPSEWVWREPAWKKSMNIQEDDLVIGESEFIIYRANRLWMTRLYTELLTGAVTIDDAYPCQCMNFTPGSVYIG